MADKHVKVLWHAPMRRDALRAGDQAGLDAEIEGMEIHRAVTEGILIREDANLVLIAEAAAEFELTNVTLIPKSAIVSMEDA